MKKFLFLSFLVASLASSLFGVDLLASLTNGKLSDNSPGVKVLSLEEAKQVKGGYYFINTGLVTRDTIRTYYYYEVRNDNGSTVNSDFGYGSNVIIAVQLGVPLNKRIGTPRYDVVALNQYGQKIASGFWNGAANRILRAAGAF
ncbi:hypothetical protein [Campylobacter sp.]|uniref:hypothetical protein n=1 Tax=Campylobacter sp. TaxID=205 RepID=UPI002A825DBF|nr:hypothetical protein [Campylobacter sp.]MDY4154598.1 hypothetical protein [Campylobacter sp.]